MTNTQILKWIKVNLASDIKKSIAESDLYTEDWIAGMICRETGGLIARYAPVQKDVAMIAASMKGDFTQRPGETEKQYHGFGFIQIDIGSYPDFVKSGNWKIPLKNFQQAVSCLEFSRKYLLLHFPTLAGDGLKHYVTAAFNCGVGNENKVITKQLDPDAYTAGHDYSKAVFEFAAIYMTL